MQILLNVQMKSKINFYKCKKSISKNLKQIQIKKIWFPRNQIFFFFQFLIH